MAMFAGFSRLGLYPITRKKTIDISSYKCQVCFLSYVTLTYAWCRPNFTGRSWHSEVRRNTIITDGGSSYHRSDPRHHSSEVIGFLLVDLFYTHPKRQNILLKGLRRARRAGATETIRISPSYSGTPFSRAFKSRAVALFLLLQK